MKMINAYTITTNNAIWKEIDWLSTILEPVNLAFDILIIIL